MVVSSQPLLGSIGWQASYTKQELEFNEYLRRADIAGIPIFIFLYLFMAYLIQQPGTLRQKEDFYDESAMSLVLQGTLALVACVICALHTQTLPPKVEDIVFGAMQYCGRWIFLTRHCLFYQALHLLLSFVASFCRLKDLRLLTDGVTLWIGMLGCFVTVQYFALVHRHPDFKEKCIRCAEQNPPYYLREIMILLHATALPLAILDVGFAKSGFRLEADLSVPLTAAMCLGYVCFYVVFIVVNHRITGDWPYGILEDLEGNLWKWILFLLAQTGILYLFGVFLLGLLYLKR